MLVCAYHPERSKRSGRRGELTANRSRSTLIIVHPPIRHPSAQMPTQSEQRAAGEDQYGGHQKRQQVGHHEDQYAEQNQDKTEEHGREPQSAASAETPLIVPILHVTISAAANRVSLELDLGFPDDSGM